MSEKFDAFVAWLETQDSSETYDYGNAQTCLGAQFNKFYGTKYFMYGFPLSGPDAVIENIAYFARTKGAALKLAKNFQKYGTIRPSLRQRFQFTLLRYYATFSRK